MTDRVFEAGKRLGRTIVPVPGDKSLSHRALIFGAMAPGRSQIDGLAPGADVAATARCLRAFGVEVDSASVTSSGVSAWRQPTGPLDAANSGTTMRMLAGAAGGRPFATTITGDASLSARPMRRLIEPLGALGAAVEVSAGGTAPITIRGGMLTGAAVTIPIPSAQVRTAVALAALQATGSTTITSPPGFRDHTERWLASMGLGEWIDATSFRVDPGPVPTLTIEVPGDPSSAAFLWTLAVLTGEAITTPGVSLNPGRTGFVEILARMGVAVSTEVTGSVLGDPVGTVTVAGRPTAAAAIGGDLAGRSLDEMPLVALVAAVTPGTTEVRDAGELRTKESDRIAGSVSMIRALGGEADEHADGFTVTGSALSPGRVDARGDHRIALAAAVASAASGTVRVAGYEAADVSWPGFADIWESLWS